MTNEFNIQLPEFISKGYAIGKSITDDIALNIMGVSERWNSLTERRKKLIKRSLFGLVGTVAAGFIGVQVWNAGSEFFNNQDNSKDDVVVDDDIVVQSMTLDNGSTLAISGDTIFIQPVGETVLEEISKFENIEGIQACNTFNSGVENLQNGKYVMAAVDFANSANQAPSYARTAYALSLMSMNLAPEGSINADFKKHIESLLPTVANHPGIEEYCE